MQYTSQRDRSAGPQPFWLRVGAFLCVLLVSVAGVAQAAHIHGDLLPNTTTQITAHVAQGGGIAEDSCPLCMAMHSALPVTAFVPVIGSLLLASGILLAISRKPQSLWYFAAFSRPPPFAR